MNFNNSDNLGILLLCLSIIVYHSFTFSNLPINIINILKNPMVLLVLLIILTTIIKNKTYILLLIIFYFVIIVKSSENVNIYIEEEQNEKNIEDESIETDISDENDIVENDIVENDIVENGIVENDTNENNNNEVKNDKLENTLAEENMYTLLNNEVKMENDYEVVEDIKQNENIISNVTQTQLDKIQGDNFNHCK